MLQLLKLCQVRPTGTPASAAITPHMITQARQGLESQLAQTLATATSSFTAASADLVAAAALFEELLPDLAAGNGPLRDFKGQIGGVASALQIFQRALEAVPEEVSITILMLFLCCVY